MASTSPFGASGDMPEMVQATSTIAAAFPVQLLHSSPPDGQSNAVAPTVVAFSEAEFEDCSSLVNLPLLSRHARQAGNTEMERETKRVKLDGADRITVASTCCRFDVLVQSAEEMADVEALAMASPGTSLLSGISSLQVVSRPGSAEEDSWIKTALEVYDAEAVLAISLPIVDTDQVPYSRQPHRFTNGRWLDAAVSLCEGKVGSDGSGAVRVDASLVTAHHARGPGSPLNRFTVELHLSVHLLLSAFRPTFSLSPKRADLLHRLMRFCFPDDEAEREIRRHGNVTASLVYSLLPSPQMAPLDELQPNQLNPTLFPFQKRSVHFLLGREGKQVVGRDSDGRPTLEDQKGVMTHTGSQELGLWWQRLDQNLYYNPVLGRLTKRAEETQADNVCGGILAEEMGLGKTVEVLALILLNADEARSQLPSYYDRLQDLDVSPTKTTLIVAPENLRQQWLDEIALHAPDLRTFSYQGYREASKLVPAGQEWREWSKDFDIVVASFDTLRKEINVARKAPERSRRFERKYERPRSLLIQMAFHRVVMDEVQLVGHSSAAETVAMIHRHYSLAVSGTPVKMLTDLKSLFHFLCALTPATSRHFERLTSSALIPALTQSLSMLATRHTKAQVEAEMALPAQTRVLVPINFTAIEAAFYRDISSAAFTIMDIDLTKNAKYEDLLHHVKVRYLDEMVRHCLISLRQACTHPQIAGSHARSGNYTGGGGTALATSNSIRSMDEVLTIMIEGTRADLAFSWQNIARKQINRAVLILQDKSNKARLVVAKEMLSSVAAVVEEKIEGVKADMRRARFVGPLYRFDRSEVMARNGRGESEMTDETELGGEMERATALFAGGSVSQAEKEREHEMAERRIHQSRHKQNLSTRWRYFMEQLHRAHHFIGNVYFQMGEEKREGETKQEDGVKEEEGETDGLKGKGDELKRLEDEAYDRAEVARQEMLKQSRKAVESALGSLDSSPVNFDLNGLLSHAEFGSGGITSSDGHGKLEKSQTLFNKQAELLFDWREGIVERLRKPVSRDVSDVNEEDDQYQENLDAQAEAEALTEMYRVMLNEREFLLAGVRIEGSTSKPALFVELERKLLTQTRLEMQQAANADDENVLRQMENAPTEEQVGAMKLQLKHFYTLERQRERALFAERVREQEEGEEGGDTLLSTRLRLAVSRRRKQEPAFALDPDVALDAILRQLRETMQKGIGREEGAIMRTTMDKVRAMVASQRSMLDKLRREQLLFMTLFNARSAYFKHMQLLSDHVGDIETANDQREYSTLEREEVLLKGRAEVAAGRLRYLTAIEEEEEGEGEEGGRERGSKDANARTCFICTEPLVKAVILNTCGHSTCENCFRSWTMKRGQCPMCKTRATSRDVYRVTYGTNGKGKKREVQMPAAERRRRQRQVYNVISPELMRSMSVMPIRSALGSKLDLLTRHLLYLQHTRPGSKSLIFTAFARGISVVGDALGLNKINYVTMDHGGPKASRVVDTFKNDATVNVLLLHSEAQSSGLNLTCAQNIFLLEPLVNHAIELQAIGRVHRIGQSSETTVFAYQVNDTVEERIVDLATERGQSLVVRENCRSKTLKDPAEMVAKAQQEGKGRSGVRAREGEFVASIDEVFRYLFESEGPRKERQTSSSSAKPEGGEEEEEEEEKEEEEEEEDEAERMRTERLRAIERRQAMSVLAEREGREQQLRLE